MEPKNANDLKASNAKKVHGTDGAIHHYSDDEVAGYVNLINSYLRDDDLCQKKLPINPDTDELFGKLGDGFILAKLINKAVPGTIDMRAMNTKGALNVFQIKENLRLVIQSSKAIGCKIVSIFPESIIEKRTHLVLGMLWQILRLCAVSHITLAHNPFLVRLLKEDEKIEDFKNLPPEEILLRWFNFHLAQAKHNRKIANFTTDLQDGVNYTVLLHQLDSGRCDLSGLQDDNATRATKVISNATRLGVEAVIKPIDITQAHPRLNLLFTSLIFNCKHGLESQDPELKELFDAAMMIDDNSGDTREERAFRMWTNSLDLVDEKGESVTMNNLYEDVKNGVMMARVMEHIAPANTVDWKKISLNPTNKFKEMENCNYVVELGKRLGFTLVNIGGRDIYDKVKKLVLAIYWQMVRQDTLATIGNMKEEDLLKWANSRVHDVPALRSFDDVSIRNCKFLFSLLNSVEPRAINWEHVTPGDTDEEVENNAKYALSVARRIGCTVFLVWEDIRDVKPKMIMTFLAAIKRVTEEGNIPRKRSGGEETVPRKISGDVQAPSSNKLTTETPPKKGEEPKKSPVVEPKKSPVVEAKKNETPPKPGQGWDEGYTDPRKLFK